MKYRILENTYENTEILYIVEIRTSTNVGWKEDRTFDKQKDAEDWVLAKIEQAKAYKVISSTVIGEYE